MKTKHLIALFIFFVTVGLAYVYRVDVYGGVRIEELVETSLQTCAEEESRTRFIVCMKRRLHDGYKRGASLTELMSYLDTHDTLLEGIDRCHDIGHVIGQIYAEESRVDSIDFSCTTSFCGDGCFHGYTESMIAAGSSVEDIIKQCKKLENNRSKDACFHGIGHGFASLAPVLSDALEMCDVISEAGKQMLCASGVFMESYLSASLESTIGHIGESLDCHNIDGVYQDVCYFTSGVNSLQATGNFQNAAEVCMSAPTDLLVEQCMRQLGAAYYNRSGVSTTEVIDSCQSLFAEEAVWCIRGIIVEFAFSDDYQLVMDSVCSQVLDVYKPDCIKFSRDQVVDAWGASAMEDVCNVLEGRERKMCLNSSL